MKHFAKLSLLAAAAASLLLLSGCYSGNIDQYYALPKASDDNLLLQEAINLKLADGYTYAAPIGGANRQSVQLTDLDIDGESEAVVFLRTPDNKPVIQFYDSLENSLTEALSITGDGTAIAALDYADLDSCGQPELIVSWHISSGMNILTVYSLKDWSGEKLLTTDCSYFKTMDINSDKTSELVILREPSAGAYLADMYSFKTGEPQASTAALSEGIDALQRFREIILTDGSPAVMTEALLNTGNLATDILVCRDGSMVNLTMNRTNGVSELSRSYSVVYAQDIDNDGAFEFPRPQRLYSASDEVFWSIAWYRYQQTGQAEIGLTTYHSIADGWYFVLPSGWTSGLTVTRDISLPGESAVTLSHIEKDSSITDLIRIYTTSPDVSPDFILPENRLLLQELDGTIYSAEIINASIAESTAKELFNIIYSEWSDGSV